MRRARSAAGPRVTERELTRAVARYLDFALPREAVFTHIASGGHRDVRTAAQLKAEGVRRGAPDFVIVAPGPGSALGQGAVIWIELKAPDGRMSPEQRRWAEAIGGVRGAWWALCRSVEDVEAALVRAGVDLRARVGARTA